MNDMTISGRLGCLGAVPGLPSSVPRMPVAHIRTVPYLEEVLERYRRELVDEVYGKVIAGGGPLETKADKVAGATAGNLAALDGSGNLVDSGRKASDFDDILEFDVKDSPGPGQTAFPSSGVAGRVYVAKDENKTYRWDGSQYVQIGGSSIVVDPTLSLEGAAADAKATGDALAVPALLAQYYPGGSVNSAAELTGGVKYTFNAAERTASVKPFNYVDDPNDNSDLVGRVVIPPFVDAQGNPCLTDDGTRYRVVGVASSEAAAYNRNLTEIVAPTTMTDIEFGAIWYCPSLTSVSLPAVTAIGGAAFAGCTSLAVVDFGNSLTTVPDVLYDTFPDGPTSCRIIVPDALYDAWTSATIPDPENEGETIPNPWYALVTAGYRFLRHAEWGYARRYELPAASSSAPQMDGTASPGSSAAFARGDHVHPRDPSKADASALHYSLVSPSVSYSTTTDADDTASVALVDRAVNAVALGSGVTAATIALPPSAGVGKARDFFLRLTLTGTDAPTISFVEVGGGVPDFDVADDDWADFEPGVNIVCFTETSQEAAQT